MTDASQSSSASWICTPGAYDGCETGPCTCLPHLDSADDACGEDEAAWCHFCAHYDCEAPCPASYSEGEPPPEQQVVSPFAHHIAETLFGKGGPLAKGSSTPVADGDGA